MISIYGTKAQIFKDLETFNFLPFRPCVPRHGDMWPFGDLNKQLVDFQKQGNAVNGGKIFLYRCKSNDHIGNLSYPPIEIELMTINIVITD